MLSFGYETGHRLEEHDDTVYTPIYPYQKANLYMLVAFVDIAQVTSVIACVTVVFPPLHDLNTVST